MQIDWKPLSRADMAKGLSLLEELLGDALPKTSDLRLRRSGLEFYPAYNFYEVTDQGHEPPRQLYALIDEANKNITVLDMTNGPVYALNQAGQLKLTEQTIIPYVAFFFSCVAGPYGLMPLIERLDLPAGQAADEETEEALAKVRDVVPPRVLSREPAAEDAEDKADGWRVAAALLFQGAVFKTEVVVEAGGAIRVDKHELALASEDNGENPEQAENSDA